MEATFYADDSDEAPKSYLKELEPFKLPKKPDDEICPASKLTTKKPTPYNRKKTTSTTTTTTTPDYSTTQKVSVGKKILSAFTRKKEEDNGYKFPKEASLDTYMNWKPTAGNWSSYGIHIEIPFTDVTFMKILVAEISLIVILVFSLQYYLMQMRSLRRNIDELMDRAHSRAIANFQVPENEVVDEDVQQTTPDDLTLLTSSTMIYSHLQELAEEIKNRNTGESSEKYLTKEFLQLIASRIAQEGFMKSNFQKLLTADSLLRLGQLYHYHENKNPGNSQSRDVSINVGVHLDGQDVIHKSQT